METFFLSFFSETSTLTLQNFTDVFINQSVEANETSRMADELTMARENSDLPTYIDMGIAAGAVLIAVLVFTVIVVKMKSKRGAFTGFLIHRKLTIICPKQYCS